MFFLFISSKLVCWHFLSLSFRTQRRHFCEEQSKICANHLSKAVLVLHANIFCCEREKQENKQDIRFKTPPASYDLMSASTTVSIDCIH